jgi:hypothetical protein
MRISSRIFRISEARFSVICGTKHVICLRKDLKSGVNTDKSHPFSLKSMLFSSRPQHSPG